MKFKKITSKIYVINDEFIYKLATNDLDNKSLEQEYNLIIQMSKINSIFKTFDIIYKFENIKSLVPFPVKNNKVITFINRKVINSNIFMMRSKFNPNNISFDDYLNINYSNNFTSINKVLNIIDTIFRPNNFIHGDLKVDNILCNIKTHKIKIIDLEFSLKLEDQCTYDISSSKIYYYLEENILFTKNFLFMFDIIIFVKSILCLFIKISIDINKLYNEIEKYYNNPKYIHSDTFLDFFLIFKTLKNQTIKVNLKHGSLLASYNLIKEELYYNSEIPELSRIHKIIKDNDELNDKKRKFSEL